MSIRNEHLNRVLNDEAYKRVCRKLSPSDFEDLYQEMCLHILSVEETKLPNYQQFNLWYYNTARNMSTRYGIVGKYTRRNEHAIPVFSTDENKTEKLIKAAEQFMIELDEFENRIVLLYKEYGNMKKVQRETGISYSALRAVKEKIKKVNENINN